MNQLFSAKPALLPRCVFWVTLFFVSVASMLASSSVLASDETEELRMAVQKMNYWMNGSGEIEGWRRHLLLNQLETQVALGNQADIPTLQLILSRFSSDAKGLKHPVFQETKHAIDKQVKRLTSGRSKGIAQLLDDSRYDFFKANAGTFAAEKNEFIGDLKSLKRHYRATLPSRQRANLFYDMQFNPMIEFVDELDFVPAPEVSVGKIDSMIRDVRKDIRKVVEKIDALPITPSPDSKGETDGDRPLKLSPPSEDLPNQILIGDGPSEDKDDDTIEELEKQQEQLNQKLKTLAQQRREVLVADRPRLQTRAANVRQLRQFEQRFDEFEKEHSHPYFVTAKNSLKKLTLRYAAGTSGNLQEDMLGRIESIENELKLIDVDSNDRSANGKLGDALRWLDSSGQAAPLVTALRAKYSKPNGFLSVSSGLINRIAGQSVSDRQPIRQNVFGRLIRGCTDTNGRVSFQLVDDPNQIHARIQLDANVQSNTYLQQGKIKVFTGSNGVVQARRDVYANVGGLFWNSPEVAANFQSNLIGTNSNLRLVNNIVNKQFIKTQPKADGYTAQQAKQLAREQFTDQTEEPLLEVRASLAEARREALDKSNWLPALYLRSTFDRVHAVIKHETAATLAAPGSPKTFGNKPEIALRIHETLASNYLDEIFKGKTFTNEDLADEFADLTGEMPPGLTGENAEGEAAENFSITFARVRPIQFEFVNQKIRVVVAGRRFAQGDQRINAGLKIILQFKIVEEDDELKLKRDGKVEFEFIDPKRTTPKLVAFRRFLDERLNDQMANEDTETVLPDNLLPIDEMGLTDSPIATKLRLVQLRIEDGWAYLGWNHEENPGSSQAWGDDLPAVTRE